VGVREERLSALLARLEGVTATGDLSPVLESAALNEARQLMEVAGGAHDLEALFAVGWLHWFRYQVLPDGQDQPDLKAAVTMFLPCFIGGMELSRLPEPLLPVLTTRSVPAAISVLSQAVSSADLPVISAAVTIWTRMTTVSPNDAGWLSNLGLALQARYEQTEALADLDGAIRVGRQAVAAAPAGHPDRAAMLSNLGLALRARFERTGALADLDEGVQVGRQAVAAAPGEAEALAGLAAALLIRFRRMGVLADVDEAVRVGQHAVAATPNGHSEQAKHLSNLAAALLARFKRTGMLADLDEGIRLTQDAVATADGHPDQAMYLSNLGAALHMRFDRTGVLGDMHEAIRVDQQAVTATPDDHPDLALRLSNFSIALETRFDRTGALADLDQAIRLSGQAATAIPEGHPDQAGMLSNLGTALKTRFDRTGVLADLDEAVRVGRQAVTATPDGHPDQAMFLSNLGATLRTRFDRTGVLADLDEAVRVGQQAVTATPDGHPDQAMHLSNLGAVLQTRFRRAGDLGDLNKAILLSQQAVAATPEDHPDQAGRLSNLGFALRIRFDRTGALADLDEAVRVGRQAIAITPDGHPARVGYLSNLGTALVTRFVRTGALADLNEAIQVDQQAVDTAPDDHPAQAGYLSNLGAALQTRFRHTGLLADLDEAIWIGQQAVTAAAGSTAEQAATLSNLGQALKARFERTEVLADLDETIRVDQQAVAVMPDDHPDRAAMSFNLAAALRARFDQTGVQADLDEAINVSARAMDLKTAAPSVRIRAARIASELAAQSRPQWAAALMERAVGLLPEVAPRQLERRDQQHSLGGLSGLAGDAAALVLAASADSSRERAALALQLVEAGRAVLYSQALEVRSDLTDLAAEHPALAERFARLREMLDPAPSPVGLAATPTISSPENGGLPDPYHVSSGRRQLADELAAVMAQIRTQKGFGSFAQPPPIAELFKQASGGPVITLNVSQYRSDALLLTEEGISSLPLPALTMGTIITQISTFHGALHAIVHGQTAHERTAAQHQLSQVLEWLWDVAAEPVLQALGYDSQPAPGTPWPRVWWAPGGLIGQLPLHAAGYHSERSASDQVRRAVMDRVISSYTPTIAALRHARSHSPLSAPSRSLIVAMPVTPGLPAEAGLPNVSAEVVRVGALIPGPAILTEPIPASGESSPDLDSLPTRANVLAHLRGCQVAHFACHGTSDPADPSRSMLLLHDHDKAPLTVASLSSIDLGQAQLAYLSACRTSSTSARQLLDEAIHLATAFQLAGFPHVIGTLWEINDEFAVDMAGNFYTALHTGGRAIDASQAARALHDVLRNARDALADTPSLWAAYVHAGA
jgi:tetratricopeptide (TPR) repeat protein